MAQQNKNLDYIIATDGLTVWEKLRITRDFLVERRQALEVNLLKRRQIEDGTYKLTDEDKIFEEQAFDLLDDCKNEVAFLEKLEAVLAVEAEKTRIPGKSDKEMYQINYVEEVIQRNVLHAKADVISMGVVSSQTLRELLRHPDSFQRVVDLKIVPESMLQLAMSDSDPITNQILPRYKSTNLIEHKE